MSLLGHLKMADGCSKQPEPDAFERSRHTLPFIRPQKPPKIPKQNAALYVSEPTGQHPSLTLAAGLTFSQALSNIPVFLTPDRSWRAAPRWAKRTAWQSRFASGLVPCNYDHRDFTFLRPPRNSPRTTGILCPSLGLHRRRTAGASSSRLHSQ